MVRVIMVKNFKMQQLSLGVSNTALPLNIARKMIKSALVLQKGLIGRLS